MALELELALVRTLAAALGLGLLIGLVRERGGVAHRAAGLRTHALAAVAGAVALSLGEASFLVVIATIGVFSALAYRSTRARDAGLTGEVTLLLTGLLGGLATRMPAVATAVAIVVALLLYAKAPLHRFSRTVLSQREVADGLLLLAAALVVLPLLPDRAYGPLDAINPARLWRLVVLVMAIGALGHIALRLVGNRGGLAIAGLLAGFVSSTAAVLDFGRRVRADPTLLRPAVAAALFANLASLSLCVPILLTISPSLLQRLWPELTAAGVTLLVGGLRGLRAGHANEPPLATAQGRMFRFGQALGFAVALAGLTWGSALLAVRVGPAGAIAASVVSACAELHAAVATLATLAGTDQIAADSARPWLLGLLTASLGTKSVLAWVSGGSAYGGRVSAGLLAALLAAAGLLMLR
jgi:uncharacterized membrane protein (DUF4010 family)